MRPLAVSPGPCCRLCYSSRTTARPAHLYRLAGTLLPREQVSQDPQCSPGLPPPQHRQTSAPLPCVRGILRSSQCSLDSAPVISAPRGSLGEAGKMQASLIRRAGPCHLRKACSSPCPLILWNYTSQLFPKPAMKRRSKTPGPWSTSEAGGQDRPWRGRPHL